METLLYFSTGDGANAIAEAYVAPLSRLRSIEPVSATTMNVNFISNERFQDTITLTITSGKFKETVIGIHNAIKGSNGGIVVVCDSDNSIFATSDITDCAIVVNVF
tara:strand:+ start:705 stop:1022 length:318 start_codon:yes stop_codon:yes gene_type:complete